MSFISHASEGVLLRGLRARKIACLLAPRRSGLTTAVIARAASFDLGSPRLVDLSSYRHPHELLVQLTQLLGLQKDWDRLESLGLPILAYEGPPIFIVLLNCHRAPTDTIEKLLLGVFGASQGTSPGSCRILIEGSVDPDLLFDRAFGASGLRRPAVRLADAATAWRLLSVMEELCAEMGRAEAWLPPWLADLTGGDVVFAQEILERLPSGHVSQSSMAATVAAVVARGSAAEQIRAATRPYLERKFMGQFLRGVAVRGLPPEACPDRHLRQLFFEGILSFDRTIDAYKVRSPLVVASVLGDVDAAAAHAVQFRAASSLALVSEVELALRRRLVMSNANLPVLAAEVRYGSPMQKRVRDALLSAGLVPREDASRLNGVLTRALGERVTLHDSIQTRVGDRAITNADVLEGSTFADLLALGQRTGIVADAKVVAAIQEVVAWRNDVAHLRAIAVEDFERRVAAAELALRALAEATSEQIRALGDPSATPG